MPLSGMRRKGTIGIGFFAATAASVMAGLHGSEGDDRKREV